jgi:microcystin-dependent protein
MSTFYNKTKSVKGFPVGSIIPWSGGSGDVPRGWVSCSNSLTLKVQDYPLLYKIIGNTYGGTENINFKLPKLNDGTSAAVDIFKGHFYYLQDKGIEHKPEKTNITDDIFWGTVGGSNSGNSPSTTQTQWNSTIDVYGELRNMENLSAIYSKINVLAGEYFETVSPSGRKLSDVHLPSHRHPVDISPAEDGNRQVSYSEGGSRPKQFGTGTGCGGFFGAGCAMNQNRAFIYRPIIPNLTGEQMASNDSASSTETIGLPIWPGYPNESLRWGGGSYGACPGGETSSLCYDSRDANGYSGGDMYSHISGAKYFFSSLSPEIRNSVTAGAAPRGDTFPSVQEHSHGTLQYSFSSKYLRVLNPGLVNDVRLNTVQINNQTGINFGTIVADTSTPSLSMQYIIKAF